MSSQCQRVLGMKGSRNQQASPGNNSSDSSSLGSQGTSGSLEYGVSDCVEVSVSTELPGQFSSSSSSSSVLLQPTTKTSDSSLIAAKSAVVSISGTSSDLAAIVDSTQPGDQQEHHDTTVFHTSGCSSPTEYTGLELTSAAGRPLILHHSHMVEGVEPVGDESTMSWLYDFYPKVLGLRPKDELESYVDQSGDVSSKPPVTTDLHDHLDSHQPSTDHQLLQLQEHIEHPLTYPGQTVFKSQEKYVVTLGAPISIAQHLNDDTLTYLNKGQFYNICVSSNPRLSRPLRVKTTLALTFFDESDNKVELNHWQYWHNLQANPNQKAFDIDRKNCENVIGNCEDIAYNATSFIWSPEVGAKIVVRINCLSTEFSSQKGVKGLPLYLVTDTYEALDSVDADPIHRAFCRIKVFRDKGAERKNKDETRAVERRLKYLKEKAGGGNDGQSGMFHPPSKETTFTSTSTLGPRLFLFTPRTNPSSSSEVKEQLVKAHSEVPASTFLANIKDRVNKRSFSKALREAKEDLGALEVEEGEEEETPPSKAPRIPSQSAVTVYVRKSEESIYKALVLDMLTVQNFKNQVARKYDVPEHMIKDIFKRTRKGLLVHFDEDMISRFQDEDDFIVDLTFDNQKGSFDLFIHY